MPKRPWYEPPPPKWIQDKTHEWYISEAGVAHLMSEVTKFRERERALDQCREQIGGH